LKRIQGGLRGPCFRFLLARALAPAQFAALPLDHNFVDPRVGRTCFGNTTVHGRLLALDLKFFLETSLRIRLGNIALDREGRQGGFQQTKDDRARAVPTGFGKNRPDHSLHRISENGTPLPTLAVFLATT